MNFKYENQFQRRWVQYMPRYVCVNSSIMGEEPLVKTNPLWVEDTLVPITSHHTHLKPSMLTLESNHLEMTMSRLQRAHYIFHPLDGQVYVDTTNPRPKHDRYRLGICGVCINASIVDKRGYKIEDKLIPIRHHSTNPGL